MDAGKPGGCDGPCREVHLIFSPSADSATVNRLMQIDLLLDEVDSSMPHGRRHYAVRGHSTNWITVVQ